MASLYIGIYSLAFTSKIRVTIIEEIKMASLFTSYFLPLVLVANIFNFQTSLCDTSADEALIAGICRQVQDPPFCLTTFRQILAHPYVPEEVTRAAIAQ